MPGLRPRVTVEVLPESTRLIQEEKESPLVFFEVNLAENFYLVFKQKVVRKYSKKEKFQAKRSEFVGSLDILCFHTNL